MFNILYSPVGRQKSSESTGRGFEPQYRQTFSRLFQKMYQEVTYFRKKCTFGSNFVHDTTLVKSKKSTGSVHKLSFYDLYQKLLHFMRESILKIRPISEKFWTFGSKFFRDTSFMESK